MVKILQIAIRIDTQNYREDGRNGRDGSGILYKGKGLFNNEDIENVPMQVRSLRLVCNKTVNMLQFTYREHEI